MFDLFNQLLRKDTAQDGKTRIAGKVPRLGAPLAAFTWLMLAASAQQPAPNQAAAPVAGLPAAILNQPSAALAMPEKLPPLSSPEPAHAHPVTALAASPWAPLVAVAGHERIYLFDLARREGIGALAFPEGIPYVLRFSRDGATLLAAGGRGVQSGRAVLFDVRTGRRLAVLGDERDIVLAADISADGKLAALGGPGKIVKVYTLEDGKLAYQIAKHTDWITALEFSPDGARLATADRSGGIHLWESATGGIVVSLSEHKDSVTSLSWRADGQVLASGSEDGRIILWSAVDGFPVATIAKAHTPKAGPDSYGALPAGVLSLQFRPDGRLVSVGRDRAIRVWGGDGKPAGASTPTDALPTKVAVSYDGKLAIAGDYAGKLLLWDGRSAVTVAPQSSQASARPSSQ